MNDNSDRLDALLDQVLATDVDNLLDEPVKVRALTSDDRLERGFLEIADFFRAHGRRPSSETHDITERRLGARLDGFLADKHRAELVADLDDFGLLKPEPAPENLDDLLESEDLDDLLGDDNFGDDIFDLSTLPKRTADLTDVEIAKRVKAKNFEEFEHLFKAKHAELAAGDAVLRSFGGVSTIKQGRFFVLGGIMLFVAEVGEISYEFDGHRHRPKQRTRVIFENGTESGMYLTSLAVRLSEQKGRAVVRADHTLCLDELGDVGDETGHIYVLRSLSEDPQISGIANLHKIGFSTTPVAQRIKNAKYEPTYLMAPVEVMADYRVYDMRPSALEHLLHRVFADVRLDLTQVGADGRNYDPSEWFVVPLTMIDQAVEMIVSGDIVDFVYDSSTQTFKYKPSVDNLD